MKFTVAIAAFLLPLPVLAGTITAAVPDQFVGHWASSPASCGSDTDDQILRMDAHHISYWESEGPVSAVVVRANNEMALIAELSGEGETWLATAGFKLSTDGNRLIDSTTIPGKEIVRHRCPAHAKNAA